MTVMTVPKPADLPCPVCDSPVPLGAERCPNPNCKVDLSALAVLDTLGQRLYRSALEQVSQGKVQAAVQTLDAALRLEPDILDAWVVKGKLHAQLGQEGEASNCWQRVLALCPGEPRASAGIEQLRWQAAKKAPAALPARRFKWLPAGAALLILAAGLGAGYLLFYRTPQPPPPPPTIADRVQRQPALAALGLNINEQAGVVQVSGTVPNETYREWILSLAAETSPGNPIEAGKLVVQAPPDYASAVKSALSTRENTRSLGLTVNGKGSVVQISGSVPSQVVLDEVELIAAGVSGVEAVDTRQVKIVPASLVQAVEIALSQVPLLAGENVQVTQAGEGIYLMGRLPSESARSQAQTAAREVPGVAWVDGHGLEVDQSLLAERASQALKTDARTAQLSLVIEPVDRGLRLKGAVERPELTGVLTEVLRAVPGIDLVDVSGVTVDWQGKLYIVQEGDSLTLIAQKMYGQWWMWSVIYEANRQAFEKDPVMRPGQTLLIPKMLPVLDRGPYQK